VAIHGSLAVRQWRRGRFPKVTVSYGTPVRLDRVRNPSRDEQLAAAQMIFDRVRSLYVSLDG